VLLRAPGSGSPKQTSRQNADPPCKP
jgi:hypothetical protein